MRSFSRDPAGLLKYLDFFFQIQWESLNKFKKGVTYTNIFKGLSKCYVMYGLEKN